MTTIEQVTAFLLGETPLDGVWFGERHPTERGRFWWRNHLRAALAAPAAASATTSIEDHTLERLLDAWDTTVLPKHRDGAMQEWMEALRHEFLTCPDNSIKGRVTSLDFGFDPETETDDRHAKELLAQDITIANMRERHAQELCAYEVTVDKLRAERKPMTDDETLALFDRVKVRMLFTDAEAAPFASGVAAAEYFHGIHAAMAAQEQNK